LLSQFEASRIGGSSIVTSTLFFAFCLLQVLLQPLIHRPVHGVFIYVRGDNS
jgi:hypothetical protein